jgi:hypothetical protein
VMQQVQHCMGAGRRPAPLARFVGRPISRVVPMPLRRRHVTTAAAAFDQAIDQGFANGGGAGEALHPAACRGTCRDAAEAL